MNEIPLTFEKVSRFDRPAEPCALAIPFAEGELTDITRVAVCDGDRPLPTQCRATATWPDGSVKWLLVDFLADLPANEGKTFVCRLNAAARPPGAPVRVQTEAGTLTIRTGRLSIVLERAGAGGLFREISLGTFSLPKSALIGPVVTNAGGETFLAEAGAGGWEVVEPGPVRVVVETRGIHRRADGTPWLDHTARVSVFAGKPWIRLDYRFVHREPERELTLAGVHLAVRPDAVGSQPVRTALATSNYRSTIRRNDTGDELRHLIDAEQLVYESNEQVPETLYGTFWADWTDPQQGGVCITVHQAQQNFPKELQVGRDGIDVYLVPSGPDAGVGGEGVGDLDGGSPAPSGMPTPSGLRLIQGMARAHRLFLHLHGPEATLEDLNVRSLQFQMPDRPTLPPEVYRRARVMEDVWVDRPAARVERRLIDLADNRTRGYGMLNWGDGPDAGYTDQGRGRGDLVWTNNEYDLPHAALLMYARTGERRMLDYLLVAAEHWMDVDVCHHSDDLLRHQGQIVHSARHVTKGVTVSHEWVEGLLDYYHQTGDRFALETALGIGENVRRHLCRPELRTPGGAQARETGWALRTLTALYLETDDEKWLEPAEVVAGQFEEWHARYGTWLAPYTDHTLVRVPFMIAVAVNSLMRYYRVRPDERVAEMIVSAMRDLIEHSLMPDGRFYYKELPSLQRRGANALILEALANAYEISDDVAFLEAGLPAFELAVSGTGSAGGYRGPKFIAEDAVIWPQGPGPKAFAAAVPAILAFYRAASHAGLLGD